MAKNTITISHIADHLVISPSTVSCVLRGDSRKFRISEETEKKVLYAAKKLGYIPNLSARSLRGQKNRTISILLSDLGLSWADTVLKGVESVLNEKKYRAFIAVDRSDPQFFMNEVVAILQRRDEAVICHSHSVTFKGIEMLKEALPLVFVSDLPESLLGTEGLNTVLWDDSTAIREAITYLANSGRKRIAFVGCRHGFISDLRRHSAFEATVKDLGLESDSKTIWMSNTIVTADADVESIFEDRGDAPDAIFAINDSVAIQVIKSLKKFGLKVPDDVAIIGLGDLPMAEFIGLSTIAEPLEELGKKAAQLALQRINGEVEDGINCIIESSNLIIRETA